ncbi:MAG: DUF6449 domain-containing protein [Desulfotomaculaceae bacterium]|nr:DUF6449 domain-containing protein [Desulfotomaculaceae bacterium]
MKSKTSLISRGILLNDFKRFAWIGAGYLLILLLSVPLKVFMLYSRDEEVIINDASAYLRIFQFDTNATMLQFMSLIIIPVLTGLLLFRYLQDSQSSDMLHALPIKRETFYNTHVLAGIVFLFVPVILTALISWALVAGLGIEQVNSANILAWLLISLTINLLCFICSVAVGMITGMTTIQGVLSYILLLLPSGLSILLLYNMSKYIYGFPYDYYYDKITSLSPLIRLTEIYRQPITPGEIAVYLFSSIALYFVGRYLYQRRQLEAAGNAITFDILRPVFKYGVTFCFMLLIGSYFYTAQGSMGWTYFGYFLGSILAYFLTEILLNKSLQVFQLQRVKDYGIYCLVMIALLGMLHFDFAGYEKRLPYPDEIKSVYLDSSFYCFKEKDNNMRTVNVQDGIEYTYQLFVPTIFTEEKDIDNIQSLHLQIIANRVEDKEVLTKRFNTNSRQICLAYELKNGKHIYRQYTITEPKYAASLKPIHESPEYKKLHNEILRINTADANMIEINANGMNKNLRIVNPVLIAQAISVLQNDLNEETYEEITTINQGPPWANIDVTLENHRNVSLVWKKSYDNFEQWLKNIGEYNQARLLPEDINFAIMDKLPDLDKLDLDKTRTQDILDLENKPGILKLTDPEQLEFCLRNYLHNYNRDNEEQAAYSVVFQLKNGNTLSGFLFEADAPAFVKEHFAR